MPLVAFSVCLDRIEEPLLYRAPNGSWWLGCVCIFEMDHKGRTIVVQSVSKERYAAGERGSQVGYWREIGDKANPLAREGKGFDLAKYKAPAATQHKQQVTYPQGEESLPPTPQEPQREPQADARHGLEDLGF